MFPERTRLPDRFVAKEKFLKNGDFTSKSRLSMTNDISKIVVTNQFSKLTLNVEEGKTFPEIILLKVTLKNKEYDKSLLDIMDKSIRSSFILFELCYFEEKSYSIGFKEKQGDDIIILKRWTSDFEEIKDLKIEGRNIDIIYDSLIEQISKGKVSHSREDSLKERVLLSINAEKIERQIKQLESKMNKEPQLKKKIEIKEKIKKLKDQL